MDYFDFLERHQATFFGHHNPIQDSDLIALGLHELKLLGIQKIDIFYDHGIWMISTDTDWINLLVGQATQHYFLDLVTSPDHPNTTFVFGGMLIKHGMSVITSRNGCIEWTSDDHQALRSRIHHISLVQPSRLLIFASSIF